MGTAEYSAENEEGNHDRQQAMEHSIIEVKPGEGERNYELLFVIIFRNKVLSVAWFYF